MAIGPRSGQPARARCIVLMLSSVVAVVSGIIDDAGHLDGITLGTLPTVGVSIILCSLWSSHRALHGPPSGPCPPASHMAGSQADTATAADASTSTW